MAWKAPDLRTVSKEPTLDERLLEKVLSINPSLRLERTPTGAGVSNGGTAGAPAAAAPSERDDLERTVDYFVRSKRERLGVAMQEFEARRRALEAEATALREQMRGELCSLLRVLDPEAVARFGISALAKHDDYLRMLEVRPADLLDAKRAARK